MWQATSDFVSYLNTGGDERTFGFYLMKPWQPIFISLIYVLLITVVGPKFMENRKPYTLKYILIVYNASQVILSLYLFILVIAAHHIYYMSKYIEFLDTVFFVLRKKYKQVSFLHIFHHGSMPFMGCISLRFAPSSSITFIGYLNSFVHIVMYSYYLFAAMGPRFQKYLTWKKYLTTFQLLQFVTMFLHYLLVVASGKDCNIPSFLLKMTFMHIALNFTLFGLFYKREYNSKSKESQKKRNGNLPVQEKVKYS